MVNGKVKQTISCLAGVGQVYIAEERFKTIIGKHVDGTAEFIRAAIHLHCNK